jgi:CRISPR-associated protein Csd2
MDDLALLWEALANMFEHDRSGHVLYVFKHDSQLGNASAYQLFKRIQPKLKEGVLVPRDFDDYTIEVNATALPARVTFQPLVA